MSKDFRPIDHIIENIRLKRDGKITEYLMEHPYLEFKVRNGAPIPLNDKECCEKYPYVSFFSEKINKAYPKHKDNPDFIEKLEKLEHALREIVKNVENSYSKAVDEHNKSLDLSGVFENVPEEFPYLKDFILSTGDYEFYYDSSESRNLFAEQFIKDDSGKTVEEAEEDIERR